MYCQTRTQSFTQSFHSFIYAFISIYFLMSRRHVCYRVYMTKFLCVHICGCVKRCKFHEMYVNLKMHMHKKAIIYNIYEKVKNFSA